MTRGAWRVLALLLAGGTAAAAPDREVLREEAFNYRVRGELPRGWKRKPDTLHFVFAVDGIPHAHVQLVRERLRAPVDVAAQLKRRATHYRFPGAGNSPEETYSEAAWGGVEARLYEHSATLAGVICRRRVTALYLTGVWFELIETVYGEKTPEMPACREGLHLFRNGFRPLTLPLPKAELLATEAREYSSADYGYHLTKPAGFTRFEVDPGADPGCRLGFRRRGPGGKEHARIRLFEYGVRRELDAKKWLDIFFNGFVGIHDGAERESVAPPAIPGARQITCERFVGTRDGVEVSTQLILVHGESGRVLLLRLRTSGSAGRTFEGPLREVIASLRMDPR